MSVSNNHSPAVLAELCREAAEHCGGDWARMQAYLTERVAEMSGDEKAAYHAEIDRILSFTPLKHSRLN